jgi:hypothetical protein
MLITAQPGDCNHAGPATPSPASTSLSVPTAGAKSPANTADAAAAE